MTAQSPVAIQIGELPALPAVALKVLDLLDNPNTSALKLQEALSVDQGMVGRLLRLSNSAHYAVRVRISTVAQAINVVGFTRVRTLMIAACTESLLDGPKSGFKDRILWEHSLGVAYASQVVARKVGPLLVEEAFVAGLMHDVGKSVLDRNFHDRYLTLIGHIYNGSAASFVEAERAAFGFDHAVVGGLVAQKWNLAPSMEEVVRLHHEPELATVAPELSAIVNLANGICVKLGCGPEKRPDLELTDLPAAKLLGLGPDALEGLRDEAAKWIEERVKGTVGAAQ
jgi:putative nucleotidyltransferase with HDIG domain